MAIRSSYCGTVVMSKFNAVLDHVMIISVVLWLVGAFWCINNTSSQFCRSSKLQRLTSNTGILQDTEIEDPRLDSSDL